MLLQGQGGLQRNMQLEKEEGWVEAGSGMGLGGQEPLDKTSLVHVFYSYGLSCVTEVRLCCLVSLSLL